MAQTDRIEKKHRRRKQKEVALSQKSESFVTFYLHASLFIFFLGTYTFLLFLHENKYPLILNNEIQPEVLLACFGLFVFSFLSLFLLSFWRILARLFVAIVAGGAIAYILGLIYPDNIGTYFTHYISFLPAGLSDYIAENGNQIVAIVTAIGFFAVLNTFKGSAMAFLSLPVLVALFLLLNTASKQIIPQVDQITLPEAGGSKQKTENLIYLVLADHAGYPTAVESWRNLNPKTPDPDALPFNPSFIPAFYKANNFTFFPSAYLRYPNKYRNIGNILNPARTKIDNDMFNKDDAAYYVSSQDAKVYTTKNDLFAELKKQGYRLNVYQTYPFDFCKGDDAKNVDLCKTFPAPLGALYYTDLTTSSRLMLLAGHFLYSMPFGENLAKFLQQKLSNFMDTSDIAFLGNPLSRSLPVGQPLVLAHLRKDVLNSTGKNVFFAHLNLPHYPYVYDQNCQLKLDPMTWRSHAPYTDEKEKNAELKRWQDYNQQLFCTYAQIQYLINDLDNARLLNKTTIVIHGDKGDGIQKDKDDYQSLTRTDKAIYRFKHNMASSFAIYKPSNKKFDINNKVCDIGTLIANNVLGKNITSCKRPDFSNFTREEQEKSLAWLNSSASKNYKVSSNFDKLYASWLEQGGQAYMASLDEQLKSVDPQEKAKIGFVAPPSFLQEDDTENIKRKTTDFVPIPTKKPEHKALQEKQTKDEKVSSVPDSKQAGREKGETEKVPSVSVAPEELQHDELKQDPAFIKQSELIESAGAVLSEEVDVEESAAISEDDEYSVLYDGSDDTVEIEEESESVNIDLIPSSEKETVESKKASQDKKELTKDKSGKGKSSVSAKSSKVKAKEKRKASKPKKAKKRVVKRDEFGELPQPIVLPKVKMPEEKWKTVNIKEGQKTTLELFPTDTSDNQKTKDREQTSTGIQTNSQPVSGASSDQAKDVAGKAPEEGVKASETQEPAKEAAKEPSVVQAKDAGGKAPEEGVKASETQEPAKEAAKEPSVDQAKDDAGKAPEEGVKASEAKEPAKEDSKEQAVALSKDVAGKAPEEGVKASEAKEPAKETSKEQADNQANEIKDTPAPRDLDQLDIIKETVTERVNEYGEVETIIFIERQPNPNRFKKKEVPEEDSVKDPQSGMENENTSSENGINQPSDLSNDNKPLIEPTESLEDDLIKRTNAPVLRPAS